MTDQARPLRKGLFGITPPGGMGRALNAPASVHTGQPSGSVTLDRAILIQELGLSSDPNWNNPDVWNRVVVAYTDASGGQYHQMTFGADNTAVFEVSQYAHQNTWLLKDVILYDFDGGNKVFDRSKVPYPDEVDIIVSA